MPVAQVSRKVDIETAGLAGVLVVFGYAPTR